MYHLHREQCTAHNLQLVGLLYIYNENNTGSRMSPCGTPNCKSAEVENLSRTFTRNFLLDRYDLYQSIASRENPNDGIFRSDIL